MSPEPTSDTIRAPMRTAIPVRSLTDEFAFPGGRSTGGLLALRPRAFSDIARGHQRGSEIELNDVRLWQKADILVRGLAFAQFTGRQSFGFSRSPIDKKVFECKAPLPSVKRPTATQASQLSFVHDGWHFDFDHVIQPIAVRAIEHWRIDHAPNLRCAITKRKCHKAPAAAL